MRELKGLGVALVTPFTEEGKVDYKGFESLIEHVIEGGVDVLVVQGTTGESATMTLEEKQRVLEFAVEINRGRKPLVFGHGGNNTQALIDGFKNFNWEGVDAILSASPYYNKPTQEGIYQHYKALAAHSPRPIVLYNVPGRTSSNVLPETTLRLARDCENIVAVKEASGSLAQMTQLVKNKPEGFVVLSGDDDLVTPQMSVGADGVISVIGNAFPKEFSELVHSAAKGDFARSSELHHQLSDIIPMLFAEGNPAGIKAVLNMLNVCGDNVRLPLVKISETLRNSMYRAISDAGLKV